MKVLTMMYDVWRWSGSNNVGCFACCLSLRIDAMGIIAIFSST